MLKENAVRSKNAKLKCRKFSTLQKCEIKMQRKISVTVYGEYVLPQYIFYLEIIHFPSIRSTLYIYLSHRHIHTCVHVMTKAYCTVTSNGSKHGCISIIIQQWDQLQQLTVSWRPTNKCLYSSADDNLRISALWSSFLGSNITKKPSVFGWNANKQN